MSRQDGYSPAQLLFGRRQLTGLHMLPTQFDLYNVKSAQAAKDRVFHSSAKVFNQHKLEKIIGKLAKINSNRHPEECDPFFPRRM